MSSEAVLNNDMLQDFNYLDKSERITVLVVSALWDYCRGGRRGGDTTSVTRSAAVAGHLNPKVVLGMNPPSSGLSSFAFCPIKHG